MNSLKRCISRCALLSGAVAMLSLTSCLNDDDDNTDYTEWRARNEIYVLKQSEATGTDGNPVYTEYRPAWSPGSFVLIHWHKRPAGYDKMMCPLDNSTVDIKYRGYLIDDVEFDTSYSNTANGDSIYRTRPVQNVIGMHAALTQMVPGDSVTIIIPWQAGYGSAKNGIIDPYSTLIFDVMMKKIVAYETNN